MRSKTSKRLVTLLVCVLMASMLAAIFTGCGTSTQNGNQASESKTATPETTAMENAPATEPFKNVTLTFWNGFTASDGEILKKLVNDFNQKNTGAIEIKMDIMPWDQLYQKLPPAIATGTAPSFVLMSPGSGLDYVRNNTLQEIGDFFAATGMDKSDFTDASLKFGEINGKQYMLPMNNYGIYFYWNKDLYKAAGLDPEKPPETLEQMAEYAVKLTDPSKNQFGMAIPNKIGPAFYAILMRANGGAAVDMETKKSALNSPENIKTFEMLKDLTFNKRVSPKGATGPDLDNMMIAGKVGMFINGPWLIPGMKGNNINFGVAAPPKGDAGQNSILDGTYFAIPSTTKDATEKKAIYEFIKFWNSPEVSIEWSLAVGFPPYLKSVAADPQITADPILKPMVEMNDIVSPWNFGLRSAGKIDGDILWPMVEALQNGADTVESIKQASDAIDEALKTEDK